MRLLCSKVGGGRETREGDAVKCSSSFCIMIDEDCGSFRCFYNESAWQGSGTFDA